MKELQKTIADLYLNDAPRAIVEKVAVTDYARYPFISRRYSVIVSSDDGLIVTYGIEPLPVIAKKQIFELVTPISQRLPKKATASELVKILASRVIFSADLDALVEVLKRQILMEWIVELKADIKKGDNRRASQRLRDVLGFSICDKTGKTYGNFYRYKELTDIKAVIIKAGICPRQYKDAVREVIEQLHSETMQGYRVERLDDAEKVDAVYAVGGLSSCMTDNVAPGKVYSQYKTGMQSVAVHALYKEDTFVARFVVRLKSKKYPTIYTTSLTSEIESILSTFGFEKNPSCLVGARLPLVTDFSNCVFMPYIDGTEKAVRIVDIDTSPYLQIGGVAGDEIGTADATTGYLKVNSYGRSLGYVTGLGKELMDETDEHDNEDEFYCHHCDAWHDNEYLRITDDGQSYCEGCYGETFTTCDDCECEMQNDDAYTLEVWSFRNNSTFTTCVCESCKDDYFTAPSDDVSYRINDIR